MTLAQLRRVRWAARAVLALAIAASITGNVLHARDNLISQSISAWPPMAFLLTVELISRVPMHRRWLAGLRLAAMVGIAGIAAWISYWHQVAICSRYGESGAAPYLLPLTIDGMVVVASMSLVELAGRIRAASLPAKAVPGALRSVEQTIQTLMAGAPMVPDPVPASAPDPVPAEPEQPSDAVDATAPTVLPPVPTDGSSERAPDREPDLVPAASNGKRRAPVPDRRILSILADKDLVPRRPDGTVAIDELKRRWGCGQDRAVRLLQVAGLHRAGEGDPVPADEPNPVPATEGVPA